MGDDMVQRVRVRAQILGCRVCGLSDACTKPVPFSGHNPSPIVVVGEAPGEEEDRRGVPFVGPAGRLLRAELDRVMEVEGWNETVGYVNVVCCWPHRTPTAEEVAACRTNLQDQLTTFQPSYCLVVGGVALSAFWPRLRIGEMAGRWWCESSWRSDGKRTWMMAAVHPAAVLRSGGITSKMGREWRECMGRWASVIADGKRPGLEVDCVKCGRGERKGMANVWDRNLGACRKHAQLAGINGGTGGASSVAGKPGGGRRTGGRSATSRPGRTRKPTPPSLFG